MRTQWTAFFWEQAIAGREVARLNLTYRARLRVAA